VFNQDDISSSDDLAIVHSKAQSEGKKDKIIQAPQNNLQDVDQPETKNSEEPQTADKDTEPHQSPKSTNIFPFPSTEEKAAEPATEDQNNNQLSTQKYSRGQRSCPEKGHYKNINEGLVINM
jgi:hypothetical protein